MLTVVGVVEICLSGVSAFAVIARELAFGRAVKRCDAVIDPALERQRVHINFVEPLFHCGDVELVGGVVEVAGGGGESAGHRLRVENADIAVLVDEVGADVELLRLLVDHPVGRGAADRFGADDLVERWRDLVELVARALRLVRGIGDHPQPIRPRHNRAGATLAFVVLHRQVRVHAGDVYAARLLGLCGQAGRRHGQGENGEHDDQPARIDDQDVL